MVIIDFLVAMKQICTENSRMERICDCICWIPLMISTFIRVSKIEVRNGIKMRSLLPLKNAPVYLTCSN